MAGENQRVIFYVDGFNFYYGLKSMGKSWKKYYWLDMVKFCEQMVKPHQELVEVNYFSAAHNTENGKRKRQGQFFAANRSNPKFHLFLGKFLQKKFIHRECGLEFTTYEEKETDVQIATSMIADVVKDRCDISILISADSDLVPPINFIREFKPNHKVFICFPPKRFSYDLKKKSDIVPILLENNELKFQNARLPDEVNLPNGHKVIRPSSWQ